MSPEIIIAVAVAALVGLALIAKLIATHATPEIIQMLALQHGGIAQHSHRRGLAERQDQNLLP